MPSMWLFMSKTGHNVPQQHQGCIIDMPKLRAITPEDKATIVTSAANIITPDDQIDRQQPTIGKNEIICIKQKTMHGEEFKNICGEELKTDKHPWCSA